MIYCLKLLILRCWRALPILAALALGLSGVSCEEKGVDQGGIVVGGRVVSAQDAVPVESAYVRLVEYGNAHDSYSDSTGTFVFSFFGRTQLRNAVILVEKEGFEKYDTIISNVALYSAAELDVRLKPTIGTQRRNKWLPEF